MNTSGDNSQENASDAMAASSSTTGQEAADKLPLNGNRVTYTYDPAGVTAVRERTGIPDPRVQAVVCYRIEGSRKYAIADRGEAAIRTPLYHAPAVGAQAE